MPSFVIIWDKVTQTGGCSGVFVPLQRPSLCGGTGGILAGAKPPSSDYGGSKKYANKRFVFRSQRTKLMVVL